jgi:hypothetical protein
MAWCRFELETRARGYIFHEMHEELAKFAQEHPSLVPYIADQLAQDDESLEVISAVCGPEIAAAVLAERAAAEPGTGKAAEKPGNREYFKLPLERSCIVMVDKSTPHLDDMMSDFEAHAVVGLDVEWKPDMASHAQSRCALLQLSTRSRAYLVDLTEAGMHPGILDAFARLFLSADVLKVGFAIAGDFSRLRRDFHSLPEPRNWLDLAFLQTAERWRTIAHAESDRVAKKEGEEITSPAAEAAPVSSSTLPAIPSASVTLSLPAAEDASSLKLSGKASRSLVDGATDAEEDDMFSREDAKERGTAGSLTPARSTVSARSMSIAETEQSEPYSNIYI